jgi:hypothetical protein
MKAIQLSYNASTNYSLVVLLRDDDSVKEFVVCKNFNANAKEYEWWDYGHYFPTIEGAMNGWNMKVLDRPTYDRLSELATLFKDGLVEDDEETAMEYFENTCEMTDDEMEYFGLKESESE